MGRLLYSKKEAADAFGVSVRTVDNLILGKELVVRRVGRRVLIPLSEVEKFARRDHHTRPTQRKIETASRVSPTNGAST